MSWPEGTSIFYLTRIIYLLHYWAWGDILISQEVSNSDQGSIIKAYNDWIIIILDAVCGLFNK
jgi:hypothetical protein